MTNLVTAFEIPDPAQPLGRTSASGPSGVLIPFRPEPVSAGQVIGRRVTAVSTSVGTYGMGGPGFFGLQLGDAWLVIALRGAASWMRCDGRLVEDFFFEDHGRPQPWITELSDTLSSRLIGRTITEMEITNDALRIGFDNGAMLTIDADATTRPVFAGSKESRSFKGSDDLRAAVFLSPTDELWV